MSPSTGSGQAVYLALGANLGNRRANLALALRMLPPVVRVEAVSPLYESPPLPLPAGATATPGPPYYNAACRVTTGLTPRALLNHVKRIEFEIGRRETARWAPRPIDIDIALYGNDVVADADLVVPHPRLGERAFVLRPLLDLNPALMLPDSGQPLADLLAALGDAGLTRLADVGWHVEAGR
jgi:2-amino-4-hydroxy-6-hydroxymethyldihydropteridine diphosphokinase